MSNTRTRVMVHEGPFFGKTYPFTLNYVERIDVDKKGVTLWNRKFGFRHDWDKTAKIEILPPVKVEREREARSKREP